MTLYLKYRPKTLQELDSQSVRESLTKVSSSGKIPHALLFSGPKGIGKTSAARIIAKILNCEHPLQKGTSCNRCASCTSISQGASLDVIELDAASHRGIEDVRALRDAVGLAAARSANKVYIIDEAHMLTPEASNALLKTLEEPPAHVYFILATTNPEKLPETIRSRTVSISFKKATIPELVRSLERVAKGEKLKVDGQTLGVVARASDGSFRDATKILEQLLAEGKKLNKEAIEEYLFQKKALDIDGLLKTLKQKNTKVALHEIENVISSGGAVSNLMEGLILRLREGLLSLVEAGGEELPGWQKGEIISLIKALYNASREMAGAPIEQLPLEVAVVEWCEEAAERMQLPPRPYNPSLVDNKASPSSNAKDNPGTKAVASSLEESAPKGRLEEVSEEVWKRILAAVRPINTSIEALLRAARPMRFDGHTLTLGVFYRFHKERLEEGSHRRILEDVIATVMGGPIRVTCLLTEAPVKNPVEEKREEVVLTEGEDADIIKAAKEIFGT
ncbi:DNA polymerase III, subunit gamma and tau [Candidatus Woesebacteria bacterium GWA1_41_8]|uniref:DNA polymerase III subunit gamma/tau n=1 Tax=Candidatus Woesebacteria bacterium GWA1_41_8 TaxID=1802471 RepID=A0A1F7WI01_9BACT|nr:MAG: DNA polymerase III, subunit gamma and tau [Candidatus Woesebacteria bacterium GWA1_41_8]